jgi:hypothetical protein
MKEADIANVLGKRLANNFTLIVSEGGEALEDPSAQAFWAIQNMNIPIAWENKDADYPRPYIRFEVVRVNRRELNIAPGNPVSRGYAVLTIVADVDTFATPANALADQVAERFPFGLRLAIPEGGTLVVISPASVLQGFRDGPDWRVPVRVDYEAFG